MSPRELELAKKAAKRLSATGQLPQAPVKLPPGVYERNNRYQVRFTRGGTPYRLGTFDRLEDAAKVANEFAQKNPPRSFRKESGDIPSVSSTSRKR